MEWIRTRLLAYERKASSKQHDWDKLLQHGYDY
jgi:hypothetical protein